MNYLLSKDKQLNINKITIMSDILLNVISWFESDEILDDEDDDKNKYSNTYNGIYVLRLFGRTYDDKSICVRIEDYTPHFYVKIPNRWTDYQIDKFVFIIKKIDTCKKYAESLVDYDIVDKHDLHYGFCDNKLFKFVRLVFNSIKAYKEFARIFTKPINLASIERSSLKLDTYESKIDPFIRFIHIRDLNSGGWIVLPKDKYNNNEIDRVTTELNISIKWSDVESYKGQTMALAKLKICSFDIECISVDGSFPQATRLSDKIVSICSTFTRHGSDEIYKSHVISLDTCRRIDGAEIECYNTEEEVLIAWRDMIEREDPDIITGYNIFGFDIRYMYDRANLLSSKCARNFSQLSRIKNKECVFEKKMLSSSGLGDNIMYLYNITGRTQVDLMKIVQRDYKLSSYKLDKVAENFMKEKVKKITLKGYDELLNKYIYLIQMNVSKLKIGNYIKIEEDDIVDEEKVEIININRDTSEIEIHLETEYFIGTDPYHVNICLVKDDMSPQELFDTYATGPDARKKINQYCIQDCALVSKLLHKLDIITNNMAMAEVSNVSLDYILMRGQGIKALSLFAKTCRIENYLIKDLKVIQSDNNNEVGYEGATVLEPVVAFYRRPIAVLDFNSLYPNSERALNMSPETLVREPQYMDISGYIYKPVEYAIKENGIEIGKEKCVFVTNESNPKKYGILGTILTNLLDARKVAKKMMAAEPDPFKKKLYDGKQNALKVTANSIYGQLGAPTSPIYCKEIAASTTAVGRIMLELAKEFVEVHMTPILTNLYDAWINEDEDIVNKILDDELEDRNNKDFINMMKDTILELYRNYMTYPKVIYGDTDSNFNDFVITQRETDVQPIDYWCRCMVIKLGLIASKLLKRRLPHPQNMEYEKTFHPFSLMAKKRYIGNKYEEDPDKYKRIIMGYTLKRRDNAVIVHKVIGRAVEITMDEQNPEKAIEFIKTALKDILDGKYPITDFITTKTLKANYKGEKLRTNEKGKEGEKGTWFWDDVKCSIAHVRLCQKMKQRDPGNCPEVNDRISFVTVALPNSKKLLQADRIEHPDYIIKNGLKIDYLFYITNQISNPCIQFFELLTDELSDVFKRIVDIENKNNDKIFNNKMKKDGLMKLGGSMIEDSKEYIDNDWVSFKNKKDMEPMNDILINHNINQNMDKPKKKIVKNTIKRKNKFLDMVVNDLNEDILNII